MLQKQLHEADDEKSDLQKQVERLQKERHALKKALDKVIHQITNITSNSLDCIMKSF